MSTKIPNWNDLRIFLEVARAGTLSGAAAKLRVDHSTISRRIAQLEAVLNAPVFERDHQGFHITVKGRELLEHVEAMESGALAIGESLSGTSRIPSGPVRIATMEGIASLYLSRQFVSFKERYPLIQIELVTSTQLVHVSQREADVFLSFFPSEGKGLEVEPVGAFPLHLYASESYLARHGVPGSVGELRDHQFVSYVDDLIQLNTVRWLEEAIKNPQVVFHSSSMIAQLFSAAEGGGIVMLPAFSNAERFGLRALLVDQIDVKRTIWMTVHRERCFMPRIKAVQQFIKDILARDFPLPPGIRNN
ncbi:LysR family transcriptional regulator [Herbaspirillum lusitanum]|uniref:LysR family transcriptional regulator n=2 Tax=Herbaspirillum lusitanum TaxID=213312 RepID=UPI002238A010|nr:LysR family transcriptional regulator [Herbaspirillum lusitanum]MCW5297333.1 LysR family transcriptional regulator [Herbaspirillum lusitanum]